MTQSFYLSLISQVDMLNNNASLEIVILKHDGRIKENEMEQVEKAV